MSKLPCIELTTGDRFEILYEDRSVLAIDKPAGWMLVPFTWQKTARNLQAALASSIAARDFWARSRNLKFLRYVHRLDAETTGILLLGKSPGAVRALGAVFETRQMKKRYLAVVEGVPARQTWSCELKLQPDLKIRGRMRGCQRSGKEAFTEFQVLREKAGCALVEARPLTGRTHQIRVHLAAAGCPVINDELYGKRGGKGARLGLRAVALAYRDPFTKRPVRIHADMEGFLSEFGFAMTDAKMSESGQTMPGAIG